MESEPGEEAELSEREREHLRHRDRKRTTRMVVDNAGVKRVQQAVARRAPGKAKSKRPPQP
jgi:hypothetical protein